MTDLINRLRFQHSTTLADGSSWIDAEKSRALSREAADHIEALDIENELQGARAIHQQAEIERLRAALDRCANLLVLGDERGNPNETELEAFHAAKLLLNQQIEKIK